MSSRRIWRNADSRKWLLIVICNTLILLLTARNATAITAAPVTIATEAIDATNYRNTRNYENAAAAMSAALTAAAPLPRGSTTTKTPPKDYAQQLPRYREAGTSAALRDVRDENFAATPLYRNYFETSDVNSDKTDTTSVILRDQMVQWRTPHAGSGHVTGAIADEAAAMTAAGFVPTTMTAAGQHYVDSMNMDGASVMALGGIRVGAEFSTNVGGEKSNAVQEAGGNNIGGSFAYATPSGKIDYEFNEDNYESAVNNESGGVGPSEGRGKSLSTVADLNGVYKYDMSEYAGSSTDIDNEREGARYGKAAADDDNANQGGGAGAIFYENHLPNYENYFMPTYQIEQFSNYHNQATGPAQAQAQAEEQALEMEQRKEAQQHVEQPQLRPLTLLNGGDGGGDDDNNAAVLHQFNKGENIENYANDRQKLRYYVKQPQLQRQQQQLNAHQQQQEQQQQQSLQQHNLQQQLSLHQQENLQQLRLEQKHNLQQQLNLQQQNLQQLQQSFKQQQQKSQKYYQLQQHKHQKQLQLSHNFRKLPEFMHYTLHQRFPRTQTRQVKTLSKATRWNYQDPLSTRRRRQQKRDATSLQVIGTSQTARTTKYSLLPTKQNFHTLDSDIAGDTTNSGDIISSSSPTSPGLRSGGNKRSISEIFADSENEPTHYSYVRVYPSPHASHLIADSVNEIDDTHNNIDDSNGSQQQSNGNGSSNDEVEHVDGNTNHRDVQQNFMQTLSQPKAKSYQLHNSAYTLPPITTSVRHTPASSAALAGIPLARHVEVTKHIAAVDYERIHVPYNQSVPILIPQPIITAVPRPYAIHVPVSKTIAVPKVQEVRIPIEKVKPFPVERPVPFVVERRVPYVVEKQVAKPVYYPYPVKVPIVKTIVHKVTRRPHTYATYQPHVSSYPISLGQYHLQRTSHLGSHSLPTAVHYTHSMKHLG